MKAERDMSERELFAIRVSYEWDFEEVDEHGDVVDHDFRDNLKNLDRAQINPGRYAIEGINLVLVRSTGSQGEGVLEREWAYVNLLGGKLVLPERCEDGRGSKVPKRFHAELERWQR